MLGGNAMFVLMSQVIGMGFKNLTKNVLLIQNIFATLSKIK